MFLWNMQVIKISLETTVKGDKDLFWESEAQHSSPVFANKHIKCPESTHWASLLLTQSFVKQGIWMRLPFYLGNSQLSWLSWDLLVGQWQDTEGSSSWPGASMYFQQRPILWSLFQKLLLESLWKEMCYINDHQRKDLLLRYNLYVHGDVGT